MKGQADDHHTLTLLSFKVATKCPVKIIPVLCSINAIDHHFSDHAKVTKYCQSNVLQGDLDQLSLSGRPSMPLRSENP